MDCMELLRAVVPADRPLGVRVRMAALAICLGFLLSTAVGVVITGPAGGWHGNLALAGLAVTGGQWIVVQRRGRSGPVFELFAAVGMLAAGPSLPVAPMILSVLCGSTLLLGLYGGTLAALLRVAAYVAVALGTFALPTGPSPVPLDQQLLVSVSTLLLVTGLTRVLCVALHQAEQAAARGRLLTDLGATLLATSDLQALVDVAGRGLEQLAALEGLCVRAELPLDGDRHVPLGAGTPAPDRPADFVLPLGTGAEAGFLAVWGDPAGGRIALRAWCQMVTMAAASVAAARTLRRRAETDPLCGVANRATFLAALDGRPGAAAPASRAVVFLDLDGLKPVNDRWGHAVGDAVLREVADRLRVASPPGSLVARLGGDEFAVLLRDQPTTDQALLVAARLLDELLRPIDADVASVRVGASVGVAVEKSDEDGDGLIRRADTAMYAAKAAGGGRIRLAEEPPT
jgi:diguanylate cyclase (GGDEF)-like protein